jgi:energy-converting hydrogenase A subunit M
LCGKSSAVRSIAEQVNIDKETVRKILTEDLDMTTVCAKIVPKELTEEKKKGVFS